MMDSIFGHGNFRNEIIWYYGQRTAFLKRHFSRKHDVILFYGKSKSVTLNKVSLPWGKAEFMAHRHDVKIDENGDEFIWSDGGARGKRYKRMVADVLAGGKPIDSVWMIPIINAAAKERMGYATQKPLALLERIIKASSNPMTLCSILSVGAPLHWRRRTAWGVSGSASISPFTPSSAWRGCAYSIALG